MDRKQLFPILLIIFTNILGAGVIIPILPLYAEGEFQGSVFQITLLSSVFFGAQFLAAPVLGRLSDRHGRRPILILSQMGTVLAFILFILAGPLGQQIDKLRLGLPITGGMVMLFIARALDGITGGNITTAQAYVSDITDDINRTQGLGYLQAAFGAGFIFGPAFGGVLSRFGVVAPFIGATIITAGTLTLTIFTLKESLPPEEREISGVPKKLRTREKVKIFSVPALPIILVIGFVASLAFSALPAIFSLYADDVIFQQAAQAGAYIGLMLAFNGMFQVITQISLLRPLIQKFGERRVLVIGQIALIIGFFGIAVLTDAILVTVLFAPFAFGRGLSEPSIQSLVTRFQSVAKSGTLLGFYQSARSLALILGPIWAGYAYEAISPQAVFIVGGIIMILALVFSLILLGMEIPGKKPASSPVPSRPGE
jgi:DHA1 family tetracycline resistance protein-like MFS transporter